MTTVFRQIIRSLRPHQWAKNLLVFFPVLAAHRLLGPEVVPALLAFVAFSATASAGYVLNDLIDAPGDRVHRTKSRRPFASGALPRRAGPILIGVVLVLALAVSMRLPRAFQLVLALYLALTTAYSLWLKRLALLDVMTLAVLYSMRLFAGGQAMTVPLSNWFLAFSMFLFLSLAMVKRVGELRWSAQPALALSRRGYRQSDTEVLGRMGLASGYLSVLVLALYINSSDVTRFYRQPEWLWGLCGLLFLWISRVWLVTERGEMHDDPVLFALADAGSYAIAAVSVVILYLAT